ncbi:hypothetical protein Taro_047293 [Colocasia esculenta]|uniref:Uncharacterized protein n=1 Tax=Colocasia esculenta TaxID=4460 RepID=A0A843X597_COLES|nr:hypothetical protein [Colocasia esculenta]
MSSSRIQKGDTKAVAFMALNRKLNPRLTWTHAIDGNYFFWTSKSSPNSFKFGTDLPNILLSGLEQSEAPVPWPAEEQEDENPQLCPSEEKVTLFLSRSRRRRRLCRVQEKGRRHSIRCFTRYTFPSPFLFQSSQPSTSTSPRRLLWWRSRFDSALLVWVRRRHPARRHQGSDAAYVTIRSPPQRHSLSRPHTPCVRLERTLEGLRKSPLTVDSHTAAGLVVPVAT